MFERFTESARRALFEGRGYAERLGSTVIDTEHLLHALMQIRGLTVATLSSVASTADAVCTTQVELHDVRHSPMRTTATLRAHFIPAGAQPPPPPGGIRFSDRHQRVLNVAAWEADRLHHWHIGTEHLLLAFLRENVEGLNDSGITLHAMRHAIAARTVELRHRVESADDALNALSRCGRLLQQYRDSSGDEALLACIRDELAGLDDYFGRC
jgi:ATP-dependent Clp protease ATP-binding subunit ClpA